MPITREEKQQQVAEIKKHIESAKIIVLWDYLGLTAGEAQELRTKFYNAEGVNKVYKNRLAKIAFEELGKTEMISQFTGPSSFLFIDGEDQSSLKILEKEISANKNLTFKAGYVDGEYYDAEKIAELAALPSKDVLLSMLLSALQGTIRNLAYAISMVAEKAPADSTPVEPAKEEAKEEPTVETTEETKETTEEVVTPEVEESTEETITNKEESKDSEEKGE